MNVLESVGLPHPQWLVLQPSLFMDYGSTWDDPAGRDVVFSKPPGQNWRGSAGGGFSWRLGIPEPDVTMRMWMAWPVGPRGGDPQFNFTVGRTFELVGRL
jgi:outer membrane protein assembly factor BamA